MRTILSVLRKEPSIIFTYTTPQIFIARPECSSGRVLIKIASTVSLKSGRVSSLSESVGHRSWSMSIARMVKNGPTTRFGGSKA